MTRSSSSQPDPVLIRAELQRLLHSSFIPEGSLLAKMLTYVVERTIEGDGRLIKAYTIAVEALGRGEDFDPDRDSTVRVAAMRLRGALDLYYSGPGADNRLRIKMSPGSYRPTFEIADEMPPTPVFRGFLQRLQPGLPSTRVWLMTITAILALDLVMTASLMAVQLRGQGAPSAQAGTRPEMFGTEPPMRLAAEKNVAGAPGLIAFDLIQHQVLDNLNRQIR